MADEANALGRRQCVGLGEEWERGEKGEKGEKGDKRDKGEKGEKVEEVAERWAAKASVSQCEASRRLQTQACQAADVTRDREEEYEKEYVHRTYSKIARHFSLTRYRPWPLVAEFVRSRSKRGSVVVDVGCGNGKYAPCVGPGAFYIGSDYCLELLLEAQAKFIPSSRTESVRNDVLDPTLRPSSADLVICIAVIHHLTTETRRRQAVQNLYALLAPGGEALVYVWAAKQREGSVGARADFQEGGHADLLVPWTNLVPNKRPQGSKTKGGKREGEKLKKIEQNEQNDQKEQNDPKESRFYHVFAEGELTSLCAEALKDEREKPRIACYYDSNNWAVIISKPPYSDTPSRTPHDG